MSCFMTFEGGRLQTGTAKLGRRAEKKKPPGRGAPGYFGGAFAFGRPHLAHPSCAHAARGAQDGRYHLVILSSCRPRNTHLARRRDGAGKRLSKMPPPPAPPLRDAPRRSRAEKGRAERPEAPRWQGQRPTACQATFGGPAPPDRGGPASGRGHLEEARRTTGTDRGAWRMNGHMRVSEARGRQGNLRGLGPQAPKTGCKRNKSCCCFCLLFKRDPCQGLVEGSVA